MTLRMRIFPAMLPVLARAQWALASSVHARAMGGDLLASIAVQRLRFLAECTQDLMELCPPDSDKEVYVVSFFDTINQTHTDRLLIEWAVEDYTEKAENISDDEWHAAMALHAHFVETSWKEYRGGL